MMKKEEGNVRLQDLTLIGSSAGGLFQLLLEPPFIVLVVANPEPRDGVPVHDP
jgi:hypothetical protein